MIKAFPYLREYPFHLDLGLWSIRELTHMKQLEIINFSIFEDTALTMDQQGVLLECKAILKGMNLPKGTQKIKIWRHKVAEYSWSTSSVVDIEVIEV